MNDIRDDTPPEWVPFETILCTNDRHDMHFLYLGIGPLNLDKEEVQLFLTIPERGIAHVSWSTGEYMKKQYHDIRTCGTILHAP